MANEAVQVEGPYEVHDFTVATGTTISGLTLCVLTDPRTAAASVVTNSGNPFAGIAATQFVGGKGKVELGLYTKGNFVLTAATGADINAGDLVTISGANTIKEAVAADLLSGAIIGKAMEAIASATTGEVKVGEII